MQPFFLGHQLGAWRQFGVFFFDLLLSKLLIALALVLVEVLRHAAVVLVGLRFLLLRHDRSVVLVYDVALVLFYVVHFGPLVRFGLGHDLVACLAERVARFGLFGLVLTRGVPMLQSLAWNFKLVSDLLLRETKNIFFFLVMSFIVLWRVGDELRLFVKGR